MTNLSDEAFAVMAVCPKTKNNYGITVDYLSRNSFKFVWTFKVDPEKAHREGYDTKSVSGSVTLDENYPGCPYCKSKQFVFCSCGAIMCWHGQRVVTCPKCGASSEVTFVSSVNLKGGGF
jgi:hypothetical protein